MCHFSVGIYQIQPFPSPQLSVASSLRVLPVKTRATANGTFTFTLVASHTTHTPLANCAFLKIAGSSLHHQSNMLVSVIALGGAPGPTCLLPLHLPVQSVSHTYDPLTLPITTKQIPASDPILWGKNNYPAHAKPHLTHAILPAHRQHS